VAEGGRTHQVSVNRASLASVYIYQIIRPNVLDVCKKAGKMSLQNNPGDK